MQSLFKDHIVLKSNTLLFKMIYPISTHLPEITRYLILLSGKMLLQQLEAFFQYQHPLM